MATQRDEVSAFNWYVYYIGGGESSDKASFYEVCNFICHEFPDANVVINENEPIIKISSLVPLSFNYIDNKLETYRDIIIINIDFEEEVKSCREK